MAEFALVDGAEPGTGGYYDERSGDERPGKDHAEQTVGERDTEARGGRT